ncbi:hypothetical protein ACHAXA_010419 [Cyclostephanos tholiformis]|jgi:hypothetical protein|uniref:Band 7 domain-containing protein n=1 Tax=Cyclostephanos tholiformis TaxID=382380 RepID=A0ABD3SF75_9STRA
MVGIKLCSRAHPFLPLQSGELHIEQAGNYRSVIRSRVEEAIKNVAASRVTLSQSTNDEAYANVFTQRVRVETLFRTAVEERLESPPRLHCRLDQFYLGFVMITDSVAAKMLETRVQNELNDRETFLQGAQSEREKTAVEVNRIDLKTNKTLRTAMAEASLVRTRAIAEARLVKSRAEINGTRTLLESAGIESQEHKIALKYIKTLRDREQLDMVVSFLQEGGAVFTAPV